MTNKLTPKQRVLRSLPFAYAQLMIRGWKKYYILGDVWNSDVWGMGNTPSAAWSDAARRLGK